LVLAFQVRVLAAELLAVRINGTSRVLVTRWKSRVRRTGERLGGYRRETFPPRLFEEDV
jgi:hypothetical protein